MGKKKTTDTKAEAVPTNGTQTEETTGFPTLAEQIAAIPKPDPLPKKRNKVEVDGVPVTTVADLAEAYLAHIRNEGRSEGTANSYRMELRSAMAELDCETPLRELTMEMVQSFFDSKRVTKLRSGKGKSQLSIDKTRRVLRLALVWAAERGIIEKAPLPEPATTT